MTLFTSVGAIALVLAVNAQAANTTAEKTTAPTTAKTVQGASENMEHANQASAEGFKLIHVTDLAQWMDASKPATVHVFDANNEETRKKDGKIPGAVTLPSASRYDVARTLPSDKTAKVVFYCANTKCMASHDAAKRAVAAGYKEVYVMADGIEGWRAAGKTTTKM